MEIRDVKNAVADAAVSAGKKASDLANKAKIRFALANLQSDLDELYEKLGKLYYEAVARGINNGTKESVVIHKIDSIKADMEILRAELGYVPKNKKNCPICGKSIPKNVSFCPYCGKEI